MLLMASFFLLDKTEREEFYHIKRQSSGLWNTKNG